MEDSEQREKALDHDSPNEVKSEVKVSFAAIFMMFGLLLGGVVSMRFFGVFGICICMLIGMGVGCLAGSRIERTIMAKEKKKRDSENGAS